MMARFVYVFLFTGVFCLLEMILRNFGLYFPFCALFVFYAATAFGSGWGLTAACLGGLSLDFLSSGAAHPWSVLIFGLAVWLSQVWLRRVDSDSALLNFLPGFVIPVLVWLLSVLFFAQHRMTVLTEQFPAVFPASFFGAVWLPVMIFLLDLLNERLSLPLFANAKLQNKTRF